jgi:hypothetical protein
MHPEIARQLIAQRTAELTVMAGGPRPASRGRAPARPRPRPRRRRPGRPALPRASVPVWGFTWSRLAAPAGGRSWLIVISVRRSRLGI